MNDLEYRERLTSALEGIHAELKRQNDAVEARVKNVPDLKKMLGGFLSA